jgi:SPASM domain peptide maturase of grasp-with-spasm system
MSPNDVFLLYACCVPVRGARRSVICDLQRGRYRFIPNGLYEILTAKRAWQTERIRAVYGEKHNDILAEYFIVLEREGFGFWCDDPERFPPLSSEWNVPQKITNAILDADVESRHNYDKILGELDDLGCKAVEFRIFFSCGLDHLRDLVKLTNGRRLRSVTFIVGFSSDLTDSALVELCRENPRVSQLTVHSAPENLVVRVEGVAQSVIFVSQAIDSPTCCGQVHPGYFSVNTATWSEAQRWNTCLNRKIAVDVRGEIKNCPSLQKSFGNVSISSLHNALAQSDFPALWSINKDQIEICKDCEFRYMCTDCRAYLSDQQNLYSKPSKCLYDPYTAEWRESE